MEQPKVAVRLGVQQEAALLAQKAGRSPHPQCPLQAEGALQDECARHQNSAGRQHPSCLACMYHQDLEVLHLFRHCFLSSGVTSKCGPFLTSLRDQTIWMQTSPSRSVCSASKGSIKSPTLGTRQHQIPGLKVGPVHDQWVAASKGSSGKAGALQVNHHAGVGLGNAQRPALERPGRLYRLFSAADLGTTSFWPLDCERKTDSMCTAEREGYKSTVLGIQLVG